MASLADRFNAKVDRTGEHHLWTGAKTAPGFGEMRVDGRLRTAAQVAWELAHGPIANGVKIVVCPADPACVRVEHLRAEADPKPAAASRRANRGAGSMTELSPGLWKIGIEAGVSERGRRQRVYRTVKGTRSAATRALAALVSEVGDGSKTPTTASRDLTVNELVEWYLTSPGTSAGSSTRRSSATGRCTTSPSGTTSGT